MLEYNIILRERDVMLEYNIILRERDVMLEYSLKLFGQVVLVLLAKAHKCRCTWTTFIYYSTPQGFTNGLTDTPPLVHEHSFIIVHHKDLLMD